MFRRQSATRDRPPGTESEGTASPAQGVSQGVNVEEQGDAFIVLQSHHEHVGMDLHRPEA
jgi:hypothetical protein